MVDILNIISKEFNGYKKFTNGIFIKSNNLLKVINFLKIKHSFEMLIDITAVDFLNANKKYRFVIIYNLLSLKKNKRIIIKSEIMETDIIKSIQKLYKNAIWYEREVWDMYGIKFDIPKKMERILTDYNFNGHPLRKDFPLEGEVEAKYNHSTQSVDSQNVELPAEYGNFYFDSIWKDYKRSKEIIKSNKQER